MNCQNQTLFKLKIVKCFPSFKDQGLQLEIRNGGSLDITTAVPVPPLTQFVKNDKMLVI